MFSRARQVVDQFEILEDEADGGDAEGAAFGVGERAERRVGDLDGALIGGQDARDEVQQRCLAGARGADHGDAFSGGDAEVVDGQREAAIGPREPQVGERDQFRSSRKISGASCRSMRLRSKPTSRHSPSAGPSVSSAA